jgi:hypothetical protein
MVWLLFEDDGLPLEMCCIGPVSATGLPPIELYLYKSLCPPQYTNLAGALGSWLRGKADSLFLLSIDPAGDPLAFPKIPSRVTGLGAFKRDSAL